MPKSPHEPDETIAEKYRIVCTLGRGGIGTTYEAEDLQTYQRVALKVVSLQQTQDWKVLELFEREARVLQNLDHPAIPKYLDYFYTDTENDRKFYLVQQRVEGRELARWVEDGWRPNEQMARAIAHQILEVLIYLHELLPPVVHRDITPHNILRASDGTIYVIDFGAVQDTYRNTLTRSATFVGTLGYAAPEQFRGQASFASDLYGLGATLLFLLAGRSPAEFPEKRMKIVFQDRISVSDRFSDWLGKMLEPSVEERFASARAALTALQGRDAVAPAETQSRPRAEFQYYAEPENSRLKIRRSDRKFLLTQPPPGPNLQHIILGGVVFLCLGLPAIANVFSSATHPGELFTIVIWLFFIFCMPLVVCSYSNEYIEIARDRFILGRKFWGLPITYQARGKIQNITLVETSGGDRIFLDLWQGTQKHQFACTTKIKKEAEWAVRELKEFLESR